ncbi:hypothetical protein [Nostoc favosum]|uniref:hypothetical protein n=1 Tax=Nostoc favosum TaxID=2907819 RepID=UPI003F68A871
MFQALPKTIAFEEFLNWKPDGGCYELHDGAIVEMQPVADHEGSIPFLYPSLRTRVRLAERRNDEAIPAFAIASSFLLAMTY